MSDISFYSYISAALAFLILSILLITSWRGRAQGGLLVAAALMTFVWAVIAGVFTMIGSPGALLPQIVEVFKNGAWYIFLFRLLYAEPVRGQLRLFAISLVSLCLLLLGIYFSAFLVGHIPALVVDWKLAIIGNALLAVAGLVLVEQLFRNTPPEQRWGIKYLCLGVGGMFAYDLYLYADTLLFGQATSWTWNARGLVYTMVVPLIAVSAARNPQWSLDVFVSRRIVFHGAALLSTGVYLLVMAAGGYYIRYYGGSWGKVAQIVFVFGALLILLVIMSSGHARASLRVFLNKHFFNYKYDYREEWLGFIRKLSSLGSGSHWRERTIQALADIVDSPAGVLWEKQDTGNYEIMAHLAMPEDGLQRLDQNSSLIRFLTDKQWVINLEEYHTTPENYPGLVLPQWLLEQDNAWVVVPLMLDEELPGLVLLARPRATWNYSWEDNDILKTAGAQIAGFLRQQQATQEVINARQFEATNRLAAFMMHDIKNMMAQLGLLVSNAEKHKHNPAFVDDMIATVENAVEKMGRTLDKLNAGHARQRHMERVDMVSLLEEAVDMMAAGRPAPTLDVREQGLMVMADADRLCSVIAHIIRNAQDATPGDGKVDVSLYEQAGYAMVAVEDTGCGMDQQFIREHLFRPFDSTKGSSGMGIGAYECGEYIRELGGDVNVSSTPGQGTCFQISIPALQPPKSAFGLEQKA